MKSMRARMLGAAAMTVLLAALTACAGTVPMRPAADAVNPKCASVIVDLPAAIDDHELRQTDAQATGAWGSPAVILLTCGVAVPGPTTQRCITIKGVDWIVDDSDPDRGLFTTFGRDPAVQVVVDHVTSDSNALNALANLVQVIPATRECTNAEDFGSGQAVPAPGVSPTPSPTASPAP